MKINIANTYDTGLDKPISEHSCIFDNTLDCIPNFKGYFTLKEDSPPIFIESRHIASALKNKVEEEIEHLCKDGGIVKVDNSEWGTLIVPIVKPNGPIRLGCHIKEGN